MTESAATSLEAVSVLRTPCEGHKAGEISFETLLDALEYFKGSALSTFKPARVPKVRANVVQLVSNWRLTGFKTAS